jgi:polysaccharide biosynthesis PFTS motif protein
MDGFSKFEFFFNGKIVGVFDTTYVDIKLFYSNYEEAVRFLKDIVKLAIENPRTLFLFKPAKNNDFFIDNRGQWSSPKKGKKVIRLREKAANLDNVIFLNDSFNPSDVISASNLVITNCFSSPTSDALSSRIPALWHESISTTKGYTMDNIDGLVTHNFDELKLRYDEIISAGPGVTDKVFSDPLFPYLIEPSGSTKGLEYFRDLISHEG